MDFGWTHDTGGSLCSMGIQPCSNITESKLRGLRFECRDGTDLRLQDVVLVVLEEDS